MVIADCAAPRLEETMRIAPISLGFDLENIQPTKRLP